MAAPPRETIGALNGLRGLACLAVFGVHWQQFTGFTGSWGPFDAKRFLENGNTGVAVLFILSGFLLSLPFWDGRWGRGQSWIGAYVRLRTLRILPAYYLCLAVLVLNGAHFHTPEERLDTGLHVALLHSLRERSFYSLAPPFWTIAVQAQSYVWMPIVLFVVSRLSGAWAVRAAVLGVFVIAAYTLHAAMFAIEPGRAGVVDWVVGQPTVATHSVLAHVPHFLLGMLAGVFHVRRVGPQPASRDSTLLSEFSVWLAGIAVFVILSTPVDDWLAVPYGRYHFPFVPLLIVWLILGAPRTRVARRILDAPPLGPLGVISFGVYVYHYPLMNVTQDWLHAYGVSVSGQPALFGATSLALAVIVATVSFLLIEAPLARAMRPRR